MDNQMELYCAGVKKVLCRDYNWEGSLQWIEAVLRKTDMKALYLEGYTEEAAAQKIFEENQKFIKPECKTNRLYSKSKGQGVQDMTGMKFFQVAVKEDRHYSRLPTGMARKLFDRILQILNKK